MNSRRKFIAKRFGLGVRLTFDINNMKMMGRQTTKSFCQSSQEFFFFEIRSNFHELYEPLFKLNSMINN